MSEDYAYCTVGGSQQQPKATQQPKAKEEMHQPKPKEEVQQPNEKEEPQAKEEVGL